MYETSVTHKASPTHLGDEPKRTLITIDLEDWFHICEVDHLLPAKRWDLLPSNVVSNTERILELLKDSGASATFFVLGYVAERHPALIEKIHRLGHEIGYHGWNHELVYTLTPDEFRLVLQRGVKKIESLIGSRPAGFRAPQWSVNDRSLWALEVLADEGFLYDSSMVPLKYIGNESYPAHVHRLQTAAGPLWEIPPLTLHTPLGRYPAGGGWGLRCLPFRLLEREIRRLNDQNLPAVFYFHPREFGLNPRVKSLPLIKRFVLNAKIWSSSTQLTKLVSAFPSTHVSHWLHRHGIHSPPRTGGTVFSAVSR